MEQTLRILSSIDPWLIACAVIGTAAGLLWRKNRALQKLHDQTRIESTFFQQELAQIKNAPKDWELRVERYEVLWLPIITTQASPLKIQKVNVGLPHCPACVMALSKSQKTGEWTCPRCDAKFTATLEDITVMDSISKQALKYFKERHPEYWG